MTKFSPGQLGTCYEQHSDELTLYARNWLAADLAHDAVQNAFIKLMGQRVMPDNPRGWLFRVVRNEAVTMLRRMKCRKRHTELLAERRPTWLEPRADDLIDAQTAQDALESLSHGQREVVMLKIWGQMTFREIAQITNKPITTIHSRYKTAMENMKKKLTTSNATEKRP